MIKKTVRIDENENIKIYNKMSDAKQDGFCIPKISLVCDKKIKYRGFIWKTYDDTPIIPLIYENEIFKTIIINNQETDYKISNYGRVYSLKSHIILKHIVDKKYYHHVNLSICGQKQKSYSIHRLVIKTFNPIENYNQLQVNHVDRNPENNNIDNLEWCDIKRNTNHWQEIDGVLKPVFQYDIKGNFINQFKSISDASKFNNTLHSNISIVVDVPNRMSAGYQWRSKFYDKIEDISNINTMGRARIIEEVDRETGVVINTYKGVLDASRKTGVCRTSIDRSCKNKTKKKMNIYWRYQ